MKTKIQRLAEAILSSVPEDVQDIIAPYISNISNAAWSEIRKDRDTLAGRLASDIPVYTKTDVDFSDLKYHYVVIPQFKIAINSREFNEKVIYKDDFIEDMKELFDRFYSSLLGEISRQANLTILPGSERDT